MSEPKVEETPEPTHCTCPECEKNRELLSMMREMLPMLIIFARSYAMASTTVSNKWRDLEGESKFRMVVDRQKLTQ